MGKLINGRDVSTGVGVPDSSTDNAVVRWDGTAGDTLQNSTVLVDDSGNVTGVVDFTTTGNTTTSSGSWIGLGSSSGRIEFDDQSTDEINFLDCKVGIGDSTPSETLDINGTLGIQGGLISLGGYATGSGNVFIGTKPPNIESGANQNISLGIGALDAITTGDFNVALGNYALTTTTTGSQNFGVGYASLYDNLGGSFNVAIGLQSLYENTSGGYNVGIGNESVEENLTGSYNIGIGHQALEGVSGNSFSNNSAIGYRAARTVTTGAANTAIGSLALSNISTGSYNIAIGYNTANSLNTASNNVFIGYSAGADVTTTSGIVMLGHSTGENATGGWNTFLGSNSGKGVDGNSTGQQNTAIGNSSLFSFTSSSNNVVVGYNAGYNITTGGNNIFLGYQAGDATTTGTDNIVIGYNVDTSAAGASNEINIGGVIKGDLVTGTLTINDAGGDLDLLIKGDTDTDLFKTDAGTDTVQVGMFVGTPSADTAITSAGGITVTQLIMRVSGSGGAIDITANPQIAAGVDGQIVIIQGTDDTNTVKLDEGTGLALSGGVSFTLGKNDVIQLMYDSGEAEWIEISRSDNA